jgi:hypothetical protein
MKRKNYKKEPKKLDQYKWAVREKTHGYDSFPERFETKKQALYYIRSEMKVWPETVYELFKIESNFVEAWER